jgi:hypothetical protein
MGLMRENRGENTGIKVSCKIIKKRMAKAARKASWDTYF